MRVLLTTVLLCVIALPVAWPQDATWLPRYDAEFGCLRPRSSFPLASPGSTTGDEIHSRSHAAVGPDMSTRPWAHYVRA